MPRYSDLTPDEQHEYRNRVIDSPGILTRCAAALSVIGFAFVLGFVLLALVMIAAKVLRMLGFAL
jgi:hypothetical protein